MLNDQLIRANFTNLCKSVAKRIFLLGHAFDQILLSIHLRLETSTPTDHDIRRHGKRDGRPTGCVETQSHRNKFDMRFRFKDRWCNLCTCLQDKATWKRSLLFCIRPKPLGQRLGNDATTGWLAALTVCEVYQDQAVAQTLRILVPSNATFLTPKPRLFPNAGFLNLIDLSVRHLCNGRSRAHVCNTRERLNVIKISQNTRVMVSGSDQVICKPLCKTI